MAVLVGKKAPGFTAKAVVDGGEMVSGFTLEQYKNKKYVILFFYPMDFTFVCPSELLAFQDKLKEFESRDAVVIGCSVDSHFSHWKWLQTERKDGGIKGVTYPLVSDFSKTVSQNYDVLAGNYSYGEESEDEISFEGEPVSYRGLFLIDKGGIVRHQLVNDLPLGRNVEEVLRMLDALQFTEEHGEVCPANWKKGGKAIKPTAEGIAEYLSEWN